MLLPFKRHTNVTLYSTDFFFYYHNLFLVVSLNFWDREQRQFHYVFWVGCFFFRFRFSLSNLLKLQLGESKWDSISLRDLATELFTVLQSVMFKVELLTA